MSEEQPARYSVEGSTGRYISLLTRSYDRRRAPQTRQQCRGGGCSGGDVAAEDPAAGSSRYGTAALRSHNTAAWRSQRSRYLMRVFTGPSLGLLLGVNRLGSYRRPRHGEIARQRCPRVPRNRGAIHPLGATSWARDGIPPLRAIAVTAGWRAAAGSAAGPPARVCCNGPLGATRSRPGEG
jgi:hypothetical protein